jgi:two-component system, cell cycle response regulator
MARILLVDDEKVARALYGDYLQTAGHAVTAVGSIKDARAALDRERFDAVVTDLILPEGDGMEVLQLTKERQPSAEVIVITALDKVDPAVRAIKSGASEYLVKPVTVEALQHALARTLTTRQLLHENESLRRHVALLETGQRIATTLDRDRLFSTAGSSFAKVTEAAGVMLFVRQGSNEFRLQGAYGMDSAVEDRIVPALVKRLTDAGDGFLKFDDLPEPFRAGHAFPATDANATWGYAVLLFTQPPHEDVQASATYLAKNLGLALRNLGRFAEVEDLAYLDDLTHLFNMRYLELVLEREVRHALQLKSTFSLLFLDLDYFKTVNDTHGHMVGSKLLVEVARIIKACVRDNDVVARYGGDEYIMLLRQTDSGGALKVAERIRRTIETHHFLAREGYSLTVTTCIGIASFPEHAQDKATLLDLADRAMYRGKKSTRNVIYIASSGLEATPATRHSTPTG